LQEVHFEGERRTFVRLGYYVKDRASPDSDYRWGSQTGLIIPKDKFLKLLEKGRRAGIL